MQRRWCSLCLRRLLWASSWSVRDEATLQRLAFIFFPSVRSYAFKNPPQCTHTYDIYTCICAPPCFMAACLNQSVKQNFIKSRHWSPAKPMTGSSMSKKKKKQLARFSPKPWHHITPRPTPPSPHPSNTCTGFRLRLEILTNSCSSNLYLSLKHRLYEHNPSRNLPSSNKGVLSIPSSSRRTAGDTASSVAAPPL